MFGVNVLGIFHILFYICSCYITDAELNLTANLAILKILGVLNQVFLLF